MCLLAISRDQSWILQEQEQGVNPSQLAVGIGSVSTTPHPPVLYACKYTTLGAQMYLTAMAALQLAVRDEPTVYRRLLDLYVVLRNT